MRNKGVDRKTIFPEKPGRDFCAVVLCELIVLRSFAHDDLHGQAGHIAARRNGPVARVPGYLCGPAGVSRAKSRPRPKVLPRAGVVHVEVNAGAVHILIVGGACVLLAVVVNVVEVVCIVDRDEGHLAGAAA